MTKIFYARVDEFWRKEEKYKYLEEMSQKGNVEWKEIIPDTKYNWLDEGIRTDFDTYIPIGDKTTRQEKEPNAIFKVFSPGIMTGRNSTVYSFVKTDLAKQIQLFSESYNSELLRYQQKKPEGNIDNFLSYDRVKWSRNLKRNLQRHKVIAFDDSKIRLSIFRPYTKAFVYFDEILIDELGKTAFCFPLGKLENENKLIWLKVGSELPMFAITVSNIPDQLPQGGSQCFPFYIYNEGGTNRRENITDWALEQFRNHYQNQAITKWDIFYYVYALLHHPVYRERYAANLKRELPRIPFAPDFSAFAAAGKQLSELHINYESQPEYPLEKIENPKAKLDWRVEKMKLSKDKQSITYNNFLTLARVPEAAFTYRLGNRSALEWVIDQYQVSTDKRSGITNDPNRADDPSYIVRLVGQVITVSLETMKIVNALPELGIA